MATKNEQENLSRLSIPYFDGVNSLVDDNLSKIVELEHAENVRQKKIGSIEKREGTRRLGDEITATANYDIFFFENSGNNGFYRISTVSDATTIYYLNDSAVWTSLTGFGTKIFELGSSTTQFDITNPTGTTFRYTYDTTGTDPGIDSHIKIGTTIVINAQNFLSANNGTFTVTGVSTNYFEITNASGSAESDKTIGTGSITITGNNFSHTIAEDCIFLTNGDNDNMYINSGGITVVTSASSGHLYGSPKARKINYYKGKLYLGDYMDSGGTRYKTGIMKSSEPLGIISLVDGDHVSGVTTIDLTDTKYIYATDSLDVYRGGTKIETLTVTAKSESSITTSATSNAINSSDEIWVAGTYDGDRIFRWATNPSSGIDVKTYDTFKLAGSESDRIKLFKNIGNVMVIANNNNMSIWNNSNLIAFDGNIGCVSDRGSVKNGGKLFFLHYDGIYEFDGNNYPQIISAKIEPYISGASKTVIESACMGKKGRSVFCALSSTTLYYPDGSTKKTLSDIVLEKNLTTNNWFVHTDIKAEQFETYRSSSDADRLEFASTETGDQIMELFTGQVDDRVSSDKEIFFRADTGPITLSKNFENFVYPYEVIIETKRGSGIKCFISLDGDKFYEIKGEARKGCVVLKVTSANENVSEPPRCRKIELSFRDSTKKLCKISRVALMYKATAEVENEDSINYGK